LSIIPKFSPVKKDRLFYDRFEYCIGFHLDEVSCLRVLNHAHIDNMIERRKQWQEMARQRWVHGRQNHGTIISRRCKEITETTIDELHELAEFLLTDSAQFKLVVSMSQAYVYTNDLTLINRLDLMPSLDHKTYTQAVISRPKDTVILKRPKHQFRSYFKTVNLTAEQKNHLESFLSNQSSDVRLSPALQQWIDHPFTRMQDYFFVDHATENWLTLLGLVRPGIIRKTMHIISAK